MSKPAVNKDAARVLRAGSVVVEATADAESLDTGTVVTLDLPAATD